MRVKCLAQGHNAMSPAKARTWIIRSGDERVNHEATTPSIISNFITIQYNNFISIAVYTKALYRFTI